MNENTKSYSGVIESIRRRESFGSCLLLVTLSLTACSGSGDSPVAAAPPVTAPPVTSSPLPVDVDVPALTSAAPTAIFVRTPNSGKAPLTVKFFGESEAGSEPITSRLWDFGDGTTGTGQKPVHTYNDAGTFKVTLTVANSIGMDSVTKDEGVIVTQDLPRAFVEGISLLPIPTSFEDRLPDFSQEKLIRTVPLKEFNPIVNSFSAIVWGGDLGVGDCRPGKVLVQIPDNSPRTAIPPFVSQFLTVIPHNPNSFDTFFDRFATARFNNVGTSLSYPARLLLIGQISDTNDPADGLSFDLTGRLGNGEGRWEACDDRGSFTSYSLSYPQKLKEQPVLRHYQVWKKLIQIPVPSGDGILTRMESRTTGVEKTNASSFTSSITATVEASVTGDVVGVSASLSATLSSTLSQSITTSDEVTRVATYTADSSPRLKYKLLYSEWILVDRYSIEGRTVGIPWSDPNYRLAPGQMDIEVVSEKDVTFQNAWFLLPEHF